MGRAGPPDRRAAVADPASRAGVAPAAGADLAEAFARRLHSTSKEDLALFSRAASLELTGSAVEASAAYRGVPAGPLRVLSLQRAVRLDPDGTGDAERAEIASADALARGDGVTESDFWFDIADVLDARGLFDDAISAFARANALAAAGRRLARAEAQDIARHNAIREIFDPSLFKAHAGQGHPSPAPIFVVGLPRSGSTLIEQILATHPRVQGLGEADALSVVAQTQFPVVPLAPHTPDHFRRLGAQYLSRIRQWGWDGRRRFVDKFPPNYLAVGLIALIFPRAVILHSQRDAMDTCLSNFRHRFATNDLSYDLAHMGRSYVRYRQVMEHWDQVLPGRVIDVSHEALVADPGDGIRWLVTEACGLPWHERCLAFHENPRPVETLSKYQVRQPIFDTSIGRWRRYERHLGPLIEALGPYAPR